MYKPKYNTKWSYLSPKPRLLWENVQLSIVSSEILGRYISVPVHEIEPGCYYHNTYNFYPECVFSYSPGLASSFPSIKEAIDSKFIMVRQNSHYPLNIIFYLFLHFLKATEWLPNKARPAHKLLNGKIRYEFDPVDYRPLYKNPDRPNPLVIRWNENGLYTPILLVFHYLINYSDEHFRMVNTASTILAQSANFFKIEYGLQ